MINLLLACMEDVVVSIGKEEKLGWIRLVVLNFVSPAALWTEPKSTDMFR